METFFERVTIDFSKLLYTLFLMSSQFYGRFEPFPTHYHYQPLSHMLLYALQPICIILNALSRVAIQFWKKQ